MRIKRAIAFGTALLTLSTLSLQLSTALAQGTAFTYQGRLNDGGAPANGTYDFQFILFDTNQFGFPAAPILTNAAVPVNSGLFTTTLDFGSGVFIGTNFWLDISVRTNGGGAFTTLSPRQPITPAPYAITAENLAGVVEKNNTVQSGVLLATISGGSGNVIQSGANESTIGGGGNNNIGTNSFIATISGGANNSIGVNDDTSTISGGNENIIQDGAGVSTIAGGVGNEIQSGAPRSTISGGSNNRILNNAEHSFIGGGDGNQVQNNSIYSTISGGEGNIIQSNASYSAIAGGINNSIQNDAYQSVVGGGIFNRIQTSAFCSAINGGVQNAIQSNAWESIIGGGYQNTIQSNAFLGAIGGGFDNTIQQGADDSTIGGGNGNSISAFESVVSGGQGNVIGSSAVWSVIAGGFNNNIQTNAQFSTVGGGDQNTIQTNASYSAIGGGYQNVIQTNAYYSTISGGYFNTIQPYAYESTIGGGYHNTIQPHATWSTIGGGYFNTIQPNADFSAIGGGANNTVNGFAATVPGGYTNIASGALSFAAGQQAQALHQGAFVWADSQNAPFSSTANDQFLIRAQGGVGINMNNPNGASLYVEGNRSGNPGNSFLQSVGFFENTSGASGAPGSSPALRVVCDGGSSPDGALCVSANGTGPIAKFGNSGSFVASVENDGTVISKGVVLTSDRNAKENFTTLDAQRVLAKVAAMPVSEWNYRDDSADKKHIGPVAQDFYAAFGLNGSDDKHISVVDEGGVALAAIQGLNRKVDERDQALEARLEQKDAEIQQLQQILAELEKAVGKLKTKKGDAQ